MNDGDKVTGVPIVPDMQKKHPTVTGYYETVPIMMVGERHNVEYIVVDGGTYVSCENIKPADRREKVTVL